MVSSNLRLEGQSERCQLQDSRLLSKYGMDATQDEEMEVWDGEKGPQTVKCTFSCSDPANELQCVRHLSTGRPPNIGKLVQVSSTPRLPV
jgi:hypothetical protein